MDKINTYLEEKYPECRFKRKDNLIWIYDKETGKLIKIYDINYLTYTLQ